MNKLTALSKLAGAYHYLKAKETAPSLPTLLISDKFGYIRRSMSIEDLAPATKNTEGFNSPGPKFF